VESIAILLPYVSSHLIMKSWHLFDAIDDDDDMAIILLLFSR